MLIFQVYAVTTYSFFEIAYYDDDACTGLPASSTTIKLNVCNQNGDYSPEGTQYVQYVASRTFDNGVPTVSVVRTFYTDDTCTTIDSSYDTKTVEFPMVCYSSDISTLSTYIASHFRGSILSALPVYDGGTSSV